MTDGRAGAAGLGRIRGEIDRIDAAIHALLLQRGDLLTEVLAAKAGDGGGSAIRPEREAALLAAVVSRHRGPYPLEAAIGLWRLVVAASTFVQRRFALHVAGPDAALRDAARFHFGFDPPLHVQPDAEAVVAAVAAGRSDLGILPIGESPTAWWERLAPPGAPKIVARLPFAPRPGHAADLPALVIARTDDPPGAVTLFAARASASGTDGAEVLGRSEAAAVLLALPSGTDPARFGGDLIPVGGHQPPVPT